MKLNERSKSRGIKIPGTKIHRIIQIILFEIE